MSELYWITVLGNISCVSGMLSVVLLIALIVLIIACIMTYLDDSAGEDFRKMIKITKITGIFAIIITVLTVFVPSTKEALLIYGVGGTIDYIRQNPTAKQLPDKCIKILDKWADTQLETDSI